MSDLPSYLKSGERTRLIPTVADTSKEGRAVSILLSAMMAVKPLATELLSPLGQRPGKRTRLDCYREVVFHGTANNDRPDGLIIVRHGKSEWTALVEGKIGKAKIDGDQIHRYANIAKDHKIDAILTVSNEFAGLPEHGPAQLPKVLARHVSLYHWSWMSVLTQALLLLSDGKIENPHEQLILREVARFLRHPSTGISGYTSMAPAWKELGTQIQSGAPISKSMDIVQDAVSSWHQEERDLCLLLSRKLGLPVHVRMSRSHKNDAQQRLLDESSELCTTFRVNSMFDIPDTAAPLLVVGDFRRRSVTCSMQLKAPEDRKRNSARINWLLRQLRDVEDERIFIRAVWPKRASDTQIGLGELRANPAALETDRESLSLQYFDVRMVGDFKANFSSPRKFIEIIEGFVPAYYEKIGQHLRAWVPTPPKLKERDPVTIDQSDELESPNDDQKQSTETVQIMSAEEKSVDS